MLTTKERELIIKLRTDGKKQGQIANLLGCSQAAVSKWISKYRKGRTLQTLPRSGRPTKLDENLKKRLRLKLIHEVKKTNEKYCAVSTKQLAKIITSEVGKEYTLRHIQRILHNIGFSLIKPRSQHIKHDAQKVADFREEFKKNLNRYTWDIS